MLLCSIISSIGESYLISKKIYSVLGFILSLIVVHKSFYYVIGLFFTRKFKETKNKHKYAILIAARNEETVIGNLLDSIKKQDYPQEMLTTFVVADNCTDNTAKIVRDKDAICYERNDQEHKTKGYALKYLFEQIDKDYGIKSFEGYFIFDADNLLNTDYVSKMNNAFDSGEKIITSFRNTKNFDENWISSTYAIHWMRSARINHRARSILHLATNIQGTGFLFSNEIVKNGWKYTSLTEDRALTADAVAQGYEITYQDEAEFFDEQPTDLKIALRQRLRWSKGHLQAFKESGPYLFLNIFLGKSYIKTKWGKEEKERDTLSKIIESIRHRFASFDTLVQLTPISLINIIRWLIIMVFIYACYSYNNGLNSVSLLGNSTILARVLKRIINDKIITIPPSLQAFYLAIIISIWWRIFYRIGKYFENIWLAIYIFITEHKRIKKIPLSKKILYCFTWPTFDIIGRYTMYIAVFAKVTWKPIPHNSKVTIDDINKGVVK